MSAAAPAPLFPAAVYSFFHNLLLSRAAPAADTRATHAILLAAGAIPHQPRLALAAINTLLRFFRPPSSSLHTLTYLRLMLRPSHPFPCPDHFSFHFAIAAAAKSGDAVSCSQLHSMVRRNGLFHDHYVQTALLRHYSSFPADARKLFDELRNKDAVHYDVVMNAYLRAGRGSDAADVFQRMCDEGVEADAVVLTTALTACAHTSSLELGNSVHQLVERNVKEYLADSHIGTALVSMYAKCGAINEAVKVFNKMTARDTRMWAAMVGAFASHGMAKEAVDCLSRMQEEGRARPDGIVMLGALSACAHAGLVEEGLHLMETMESRFDVSPEHEHYSCAVDMLCRTGKFDDAMQLVRRMPMRPEASVWGAVISGCRMHKNVELAEFAAGELQKLADDGVGDDEGVYVQLSNILQSADRKDDARRVRMVFNGGSRLKKTVGESSVKVDGATSAFVSGDLEHPRRAEIWELLELLYDEIGRQSPELEEATGAGTWDEF